MDPIPLEAGLSSEDIISPTAAIFVSSLRSLSQRSLLESRDDQQSPGSGQDDSGLGIVSFLTAIATALVIFGVQTGVFLALRNKLARIFKPKTYLVPERERTEPPAQSMMAMLRGLVQYSDREIINKCGLDAYFFLRYLKTLLIIFIPICAVVLPILIPINYINGRGQSVDVSKSQQMKNQQSNSSIPVGLDTLAWGNIQAINTDRYLAHLLLAILVVIWVCGVFFFELKVYIKVRQDYLTSAEHRLRASATTVLVNSIPSKWLTEEALLGLFDVFPGGVRNVWLNRDLSKLLDKISQRDNVHSKLESAETELIKAAKKAQLKHKKADEKKRRRKLHLKALTKADLAAREAEENAEAERMANSGEGTDAGNRHEVPHTVADGLRESEMDEEQHEDGVDELDAHDGHGSSRFKMPDFKNPLTKVGSGFRGAVSRTGNEMDEVLQTTNGLVLSADIGRTTSHPRDSTSSPPRFEPLDIHPSNTQPDTPMSASSTKPIQHNEPPAAIGNTVRKLTNAGDMYAKNEAKFWQFWKPPPGGYTWPMPQGPPAEKEKDEPDENKTAWQKCKSFIPFMGGDDEDTVEYPLAYNPDYKEDQEDKAAWEQYLKKKDRPMHRLPLFGVKWLFGVPFVTKKVDTIYTCREELARLTLEIEADQKHPERFPLMTSAFVQFNHQVAAHMACQSAVHHLPRQMSPRMLEIAPGDVLWNNMAFTWWQEWLRTAIVTAIIAAMIALWAIPVAWTAALSQLPKLIQDASWFSGLRDNQAVATLVKAIAGPLPAALLGLLLFLVPLILDFLAGVKGVKTRAQKSEFVQIFYFVFLFFQVFLIVSIASFFAASLNTLVDNLAKLNTVSAVLDLLATNLPGAANYFFTYMVLQALSTSSGTLLQIGALLMWFVIGPIMDSTARQKWSRNTNLNQIRWGSFFPVYTNFACIALVYSIIAPLISIFAIITFGLLWIAHRYAMLYVNRFENDTGGVLYPRAINQTFTGLYVMELCLAGLFFLVLDEHDKHVCTTHGTIMIVVLILTIIYQLLLNMSFGPLFRYLPITYEDEAVIRDEVFQRAQDRLLGLIPEESEDEDDTETTSREEKSPRLHDDQDIELRHVQPRRDTNGLNPVQHMTGWAKGGSKQVGNWAKGGGDQFRKLKNLGENPKAAEYRRRQRQKDLESQRAIGEALYGGIHDEIEDLTPDERDVLTRHAFQHQALRARRPTVWLPRDDIGISDDEIRRTQAYSDNIWISNEGTALDSKLRVVYGKKPPDFSEVDLINL